MKEIEHKLWAAACTACEDVISTPVCPECVADLIADAVARHDPATAYEIREYAKSIMLTGDELSGCIKCGNRISVCAYCFIGEMIEMFKDRVPEIVETCQEHFGYGEFIEIT